MLKRLTQRGDTIIEVLIALAILGSAFGIAYATANKGLQGARNAEEHSQALEYINQQIELLRSAAGNANASTAGIFAQAGAFCLVETAPVSVRQFSGGYIPANTAASTDVQNAAAKYPAQCSANSLYYYSITFDNTSSQDVFNILVRWQGIGTFGPQQESLSYRLHP